MDYFEYLCFKKFSKIGLHKNIYIAYSGGLDSSVLLYVSSMFFKKKTYHLRAIHINYLYNKKSNMWADFCRDYCSILKVPLYRYISKYAISKNLEQNFRFIRFNLFFNLLKSNSTLMFAHHSDDFLETFFFKLFRGAGFASLLGIEEYTKIGKLNIFRPFLSFKKIDINQYALKKKIKYIYDFSNLDCSFDRNYIRNQIMPLINRKWPSLRLNILKMKNININFYRYLYFKCVFFLKSDGFNLDFLDIRYLLLIPTILRFEIIRYWIKINYLTMPFYSHFKELNKILDLRDTFNAFIKIGNYKIKKLKKILFLEILCDYYKKKSLKCFMVSFKNQYIFPVFNSHASYFVRDIIFNNKINIYNFYLCGNLHVFDNFLKKIGKNVLFKTLF